jgi:hypothetical protein
MQPTPERRFATSWFSIVGRTQDNAGLFRHYAETECFNPELMRADRLGDLIEALVAAAPRLQRGIPWTTRSAISAA